MPLPQLPQTEQKSELSKSINNRTKMLHFNRYKMQINGKGTSIAIFLHIFDLSTLCITAPVYILVMFVQINS
jgi:hypothetical protein